jgi:hypothetical protein
MVLLQQSCQRVHIGSGGRHWHPDQVQPPEPQGRKEIRVAGIVHEHGITGMGQAAHDQVHALAGAGGEQDLRRGRFNLQLGEIPGDLLPQRLEAFGVAVTHHPLGAEGELAKTFADRLQVVPVFRQPATAGGNTGLALLEDIAQ